MKSSRFLLIRAMLLFSFFCVTADSYPGLGINYSMGKRSPIGLGFYLPFSDSIAIGGSYLANKDIFNRTLTQPSTLFENDTHTGSLMTLEVAMIHFIYTPVDFLGLRLGGEIGAGVALRNHYLILKETRGSQESLYYGGGAYKTAVLKEKLPFVNIAMAILSKKFYLSAGYSFVISDVCFKMGYRVF